MDDTSKDISVLFNQRLMNLSGEERLCICSNMFDTARDIVISSLSKGLSVDEFRKQLFIRLYANDFSTEEKELILRSWS